MVVPRDTDAVPDEYEPVLGSADELSLAELIEEQVLLAMPLVPAHEDAARCAAVLGAGAGATCAAVEAAPQVSGRKADAFCESAGNAREKRRALTRDRR